MPDITKKGTGQVATTEELRELRQRIHDVLRSSRYSYLTEKAYVGWIRRYIVFNRRRHPATLGAEEAESARDGDAVAARRR